ncbi:MAG TPA: TIGR00725 family protein [Methanosarcinaceae archaeon]|nr:TIGR00725 family protein [Methanosarcinaceae archaeon]
MASKLIGVIGAGMCDDSIATIAENVGREIAKRGAILICGGLGGVMQAAARGANKEGGTTIGILPGSRREDANPYIDIAILSAMGHARNAIIAQSSDALIAVNGEYGTLSEIALSLKMGKTVVVLESKWKIDGVIVAKDAREAVEIVFGKISVR